MLDENSQKLTEVLAYSAEDRHLSLKPINVKKSYASEL
jgi:hypothetical protein